VKVLLDSKVLVSAFATRGLCADVLRVVLSEHDLVTADVIIEEVGRALRRKLRVARDVVDGIRSFLRPYATNAEPVLAIAIAAGVDVLVTGDRDLLEVKDGIDEIRIVDPRGFQALVARRD
jgi:uncharacterized protein